MSYKGYIKEVADFPKDGVSFKDISPLLADEQTFRSELFEINKVKKTIESFHEIQFKNELFCITKKR